MNPRENALRTIRFEQPEWVMAEPPLQLLSYHGCNHHGFDGGAAHDSPVGARWTDIWGTGWHKIQPGVMGMPELNPLARIEDLKTYRWPDPDDERICAPVYRQAAEYVPGEDVFLAGQQRDTLWEKSYMLVGMEQMLVSFLLEPEFAREVLHRIMDFQLGIARHYLNVGVEFVQFTDDLGAQGRPLLSPRIVAEFLVPEYERLFALYREKNVLIWFHSCGTIEPFIETFIKLGVNVLNPVQATANNLERLRAQTQGRLALHGAVNSAVVMDGPPERIAAEVKERIRQLGQGGGYFCSPDQGLPYPAQHLKTFHEAVEHYGRYPIVE